MRTTSGEDRGVPIGRWSDGVLGVCGYSGSGKTTLLEALIPRLTARGLLSRHAQTVTPKVPPALAECWSNANTPEQFNRLCGGTE